MAKRLFLSFFLVGLVSACGPASGEDEETSGSETAGDETAGDDGDLPPDRDELVDEITGPGPHLVGYQEVEVSYRPPGSDEDRTLPVLVWYPADPETDAPPVTYAVAGIVERESDVALDGPDPAEGTFPVVVYSHGNGGEGLLAYPYAEHFASHGWLVVSPSHVGNTALDLVANMGLPLTTVAVLRPLDISAVLDAVDGGDGVFASGDTDDVFAFGHSFGGYTTYAVGGAEVDRDGLVSLCTADCAYLEDPEVIAAFDAGFGDPRVDALGPQAPAFISAFADGGLTQMQQPALVQTGAMDITTTLEDQGLPFWEAMDGEGDYWLNMPTGGHLTFISVCHDLGTEVLDIFQPSHQSDGCGPDAIPTTEALPAMAWYMLAFAKQQVLGMSEYSVIFEEGEPLHPGMEINP